MSAISLHSHWPFEGRTLTERRLVRAPKRARSGHPGIARGAAFTLAAAFVGFATLATAATPLTPLAARTLYVEHAQSLAFVMPAPARSDYQPMLSAMLPVTDSGNFAQCAPVAANAGC